MKNEETKFNKNVRKGFSDRHEEISWFNQELRPKGYWMELSNMVYDVNKPLGTKKKDNKIKNREGRTSKSQAMGMDCLLKSENQLQITILLRHSNDRGFFLKQPNDVSIKEYLKSKENDIIIYTLRNEKGITKSMSRPIQLKELFKYGYSMGIGKGNTNRIQFNFYPKKLDYFPLEQENIFEINPTIEELLKLYKKSLK